MKKRKAKYSIVYKCSAVFLSLTLLWLTISTPFVFASQQESFKSQQLTNMDTELPANEEESNPFGNTQEEKAPSGNALTEEFLHESHAAALFFTYSSKAYKCHDVKVYVAFHGELIMPPPDLS